jgi:NitT/TauT family transport system substrate-binding protein
MLPWSGCSSTSPPAPSEELSVAITREPLGSLMVVASEKGFFTEEGVSVTIVDKYPSGKRALQGLLGGEVDVAPTAEAPIMFRSFERDDFAVVATIGSSDNEPKIVARKDSGIEEPEDLRGKRVATQQASAVHYFLHLFLLRHRIPEDEVELSYLKAEELAPALAEGHIDAFSMREPFVSEARRLVGGEVIVWSRPGLYVKTFNLAVLKQVIREKPEAVQRVLRALVRAEQFAREHPEDAIDIVAKRLETDRAALADIWAELDLRISLGQQLLRALEEEARWALDSGFVQAQQAPNYLEFFHVDALKEVKPTAVTVIH